MDTEAELFKALSHPIRLRMAVFLAMHGETCVCHLAGAMGEPDFKISRHLAIMRSAGMVTARRQDTWMHYRLTEPRSDIEGCLQNCLRHCFVTHPAVCDDLKRFETIVEKAPCPECGAEGDGLNRIR